MEAWPDGRDAATESTRLMAPRALKRTGIVAGVAAGAVGIAYATERALVARLRHREDPDAGLPLVPEYDAMRVLDSHDGGTIYTISRGDGPPVVFCHGVTLSSRVWAKQFESFPAAGFRAVAFDSRGHGESVVGDTGHSIDNLADDLRSVLEGLDLRDVVLVGHSMGGMAVQAFAIRHPDVAARARARVGAAVDLVAQPGQRRPPRARGARTAHAAGSRPRRVHAAPQPRVPAGADRLRRRPAPEPRRGDPRDARGVQPRHDPRRRHRAAQPRPHRGTAVDRRADPRAGGDRRRARRRRATRAASSTSSPGPAWSSTPAPATCSCTSAPKRSTRSIMDFARQCQAGGTGAGALDESSAASAG